jgi:localization factor PodJL
VSDRNTQDALESVHSTLGHVVDRLATIEGDLRDSRAARTMAAAVEWPPAQTVVAAQSARGTSAPPMSSTALSAPMPAAPRAPEPRPELPNPAATVAPAAPVTPQNPPAPALKDILIGAPREEIAITPPPARDGQPPRAPIDPSLPPDFPLEPGTRPQDRPAAVASPSQRIAASEQVLSEIPTQPQGPVSTSSFIAAARRAAQAAAGAPPKDVATEKPRHVSVLDAKGRQAAAGATGPTTITAKIRSLLVGASVVVIVLSGFKMAMTMLEGGGAPAPVEQPAEPAHDKASDATPLLPPAPSSRESRELTLPTITSPTPMERQGSTAAAPSMPAAESHDAVPARPSDVTGAIPMPPVSAMPAPGADHRPPTPAAPASLSPVSDALPDAIGGPLLRAAALRGDPTAAFEVASRYSDGRGVPVNYDEAMKWFDRASDGGVVPAMFRLGTMYEKGLGGKKDVDAARRYYIRAAERGNAKAMHNLAVLDADGGARGPNYKSAAEWFRKAADHGVADSQFNLGILYARGIGVEQNLAESYKWFSLAAAQGDADAGRKRDDVAKRLDAQSLAAAKLAVQTFVVAPQPDDAVNVVAPAGGWDATPAPSPKPAQKRGRVAVTAARQIAQVH